MATASGYLYRHIRLDKNEPFYIGIGFSNNEYAKKGYYRAKTKNGRNKIWKDIVAKTDYEVQILFENLPLSKLIEKEIEFINLYGRIDNKTGTLANFTNGGQGTLGSKHNLGKKHTSFTKIKIRLGKGNVCCNYNENLKIPILEFDLNMNFVREYESIRSTKNYGFDPTCVQKCCKGIKYRHTHKGSIFKYKNIII
jgi:hypothetical protein